MKFKVIIAVLILFIGIIISSGCTIPDSKEHITSSQIDAPHVPKIDQLWKSTQIPGKYDSYQIMKNVIPEDNVTCYVMVTYNGGGISCLDGIR